MRTLFQSILAFLTLGMCSMGCSKTETPAPPAGPTDVVLTVPGMF
jgi:hypothetical protein